MALRSKSPHLRKAATSGRAAVEEAVAAALAAAAAARSAGGALGHVADRSPSKPHPAKTWTSALLAGARGAEPRRRVETAKARAKSPPARRGKPAKPTKRRAALRSGVQATTVAPFTATGWLLLAGIILAWPREDGPDRIEGRVGDRPDGLRDRLRAELSTSRTHAADLSAAEPGRGRDATTPSQIPPRGWREVLARTWTQFNQDRIMAVAGGVTFFGLLALFPAMAAFVSLYGLFFSTKDVADQLKILAGVMPAEGLKFIGEQMVRMAQAGGGTLSFTFVSTLLISLWSANSGVKALFDGLNVAYEEREKRGLIKLNLYSLGFTVGAIAFLTLASASVIAVPVILGLFPFKLGGIAPLLDFARWPLLLLGVALGLAVLYRYGPSRQHPRWAWITPGGATAAVLWLAASMLFSFYVSHFGSYNKTYGSLGAVVGFMTWMWISSIIVLFGAELNAELEHQTAADTTTGAARPLGQRGAKMADTVAQPAHG